jgi:hypothetical protein
MCYVILSCTLLVRIQFYRKKCTLLRGLVISSPPAKEETGAMGREIESRLDIR